MGYYTFTLCLPYCVGICENELFRFQLLSSEKLLTHILNKQIIILLSLKS